MRNSQITFSETSADAEAWDSFAARCGTSFRGLYGALRLYQLETHLFFCLKVYDVHLGSLKIGQFAIGLGRKLKVLDNGIALLSGYEEFWLEVLNQILIVFGRGAYRYGNEWSLEKARDTDLVQLPGIVIVQSKKVLVHAVDFAQWKEWADCYDALSLNIRRNVKKARKVYSADGIVVQRGLAALNGSLRLAASRKAMFRQKGVRKSSLRMMSRGLLRFLATHRHTFFAKLCADAEMVAGFTGIEVGPNTFYLESAHRRECHGGGWLLMMAMLERAYNHSSGAGCFVMGPDDGTSSDKAWRGVQSQRQQCRTTAFETSIVTFSFEPP